MKRLLHMLLRGLVFLATIIGLAVLATMAMLWVSAKRDVAARPMHEFAPTPWPPQSNSSSSDAPGPGTSESAAQKTSPTEKEMWTRDEIRQLRDSVQNDTITWLMQMLRNAPDAAVNFQDAVDASPRNTAQVRADFSRLSRLSRGINQHTSWPLEAATPTDTVSKKAYTIPSQYLDWWFED